MTTRQRTVPGTDVFARTVPLLLEKHYFGESKSASMAPVSIDGQTPEQQARTKALMSLSKKLLNSEEVRAVRYRDIAFRSYLNGIATPFRPGLWLVPVTMTEVAYSEAQRWERERSALADAAAAAYPRHVAAMREPLGPMYDPRDYPPADVFRSKYWVSWRFINFGVSEVLKEIRADIFRLETEKLQRQASEARTLIEQHLRGSLLDITAHLRDLIAPKASGKRVAVKAGSFEKLNQFLETVEARDVTGDEDLRRVVRQLRTLNQGLDLEVLNDDEAVRDRVEKQMGAIVESLEGLVVDAPARGIRIREDVA